MIQSLSIMIHIEGPEGSTVMTFQDKTVISCQKDNCRRILRQRTLNPLSVPANKKVVSDIGIRMNLVTVVGDPSAIEQSIRLEVELRSLQEQELHQLRQKLQRIQRTADEIRTITDRLH
jgi:hypothetical protein